MSLFSYLFSTTRVVSLTVLGESKRSVECPKCECKLEEGCWANNNTTISN